MLNDLAAALTALDETMPVRGIIGDRLYADGAEFFCTLTGTVKVNDGECGSFVIGTVSDGAKVLAQAWIDVRPEV